MSYETVVTEINNNISIYPSDMKGSTENGSPLSHSASGSCLEAVRFRPGSAAGSACPLWLRSGSAARPGPGVRPLSWDSGPTGAPGRRGWTVRLGSDRYV